MKKGCQGGIRVASARVADILGAGLMYVRNRFQYRVVEPPFRPIFIDPRKVERKLKAEPDKARGSFVGEVRGGDWDLDVQEVVGLKHDSIRDRFLHGIPWGETELFRSHYSEVLKTKGEVRGCRSMEDLIVQHEKRYDVLFASMKEHGFISPRVFSPGLQPIFVYIGREGEILWSANGNHRLTIAKILEINRVPVWVRIRHAAWQQIRERLVSTADSEPVVRSDRHLQDHPDLRAIVSKRVSRTNGLKEKSETSR